jgi:histidine ammonia-lyase
VDPALSGLPAFLTRTRRELGTDDGADRGAALVTDLRLRAHPASTDSVPTDANKEDHVSMGVAAALKAREAVTLLETMAALELLTAAQALEFLQPLHAGPRRRCGIRQGARRRCRPWSRTACWRRDIAALERSCARARSPTSGPVRRRMSRTAVHVRGRGGHRARRHRTECVRAGRGGAGGGRNASLAVRRETPS